jgi:hypothetical protein
VSGGKGASCSDCFAADGFWPNKPVKPPDLGVSVGCAKNPLDFGVSVLDPNNPPVLGASGFDPNKTPDLGVSALDPKSPPGCGAAAGVGCPKREVPGAGDCEVRNFGGAGVDVGVVDSVLLCEPKMDEGLA